MPAAIALMYLAGKLSKFEVVDWVGRQPHHLRWWDMFVEDISMELMEGKSNNPCREVGRGVRRIWYTARECGTRMVAALGRFFCVLVCALQSNISNRIPSFPGRSLAVISTLFD